MKTYGNKIRSFALCATAVVCTVLAGSNALLMPADTYAASAARPAVGATSAAATAGYSKQKLRPRFNAPKRHGRKPHSSKSDFQGAAYVNTPNNLLMASTVPAPVSADLAETEDVVLTPAIRDLADSLGKNPVQIYNWVRDHIVFAPTYGSMQGADATLQTRHGNAFDTASLLIALLRASDIPARYVYGTVEIPAASAENWVGNVSVPEAAVSLFDQGGIPVQGVTGGGTLAAIQIEHIWVEAFVDFSPSRGAKNRTPTTWVPLDASYKQYRYTPGIGVSAAVTLDTATLAGQLTQSATISSDSITSLNTVPLSDAFTDFTTRASSYIASHKANATVSDVLGTQSTIFEDLPLLAGALPYKTVAIGGIYSDLPDTLRWRVQYGVYATDFDREQGNAIASIAQSLPQLVGKRLTLSFIGATSGDSSKLASALNSNPLPLSVNGASTRMMAQLTVDGQVVSSGGGIPLGSALVGGLGIFDPQIGDWEFTANARVLAGETHSLALVGGSVSPAVLASSRDRLAAMAEQVSARQYTSLTQDAYVGEILDYAALSYATTVASNSELMCKACGIVGYALPTIIRVDTSASATIVGGLPQSVTFPGVALQVEAIGRTAVAVDNNAARALAFQRSYGERASAYTHLLLDSLFTDTTHTGKAASTVRALEAANTAGKKIFLLTAANSGSIIPQLNVDPTTISVLQDAIGAGRSAMVSQSAVTIDNWSGVGYLLEDPAVGSGDYEISGRDEADLNVGSGWLPLALAGPAFSVQGDAVAAATQGIVAGERSYYNAAIALLADYGSIAWSNFVAAPIVTSQWFLCALWNGLPVSLSDPGTSIVSAISVDEFTDLPGAPQTNNPPYFTSMPVVAGAVGQPYQYLATAIDPDGDAMTLALASGPSGMTLSAMGLLSWSNPITGTYPVTVRVSDGKADVDQSFTLTVGKVLPLDLNLAVTPQFVNVGATVTITAATTGGSGTVAKTLTVDGANVSLDANGQAKVIAQVAGAHAVVAMASDNQVSLAKTSAFGVHVSGDTTAPSVAITAPADSAVLTAPTQVSGGVSDANLLYWQLLLSPSGQAQWKELARGTSNVSGALAMFDPTQIANGQYDLNLIAYDANGLSKSAIIHVIVQGDLKLGLFTVSFNDLQLDVGGIPLTITRTYDSRKKDTKGDFGFGWTLSYQNVNLQRSRALGETWESYQQGLLTFCLRPIGKRTVSIGLADGKVHQFDVVASPQCDTGQVPAVFTMAFTPRAGTTSSLAVLDGGDLLFQGGTVYDSGTGDTYDSFRYQLTTLDNYKYVLKSGDNAKTFQVIQITDPNGEVLTLNAQGVTSSNGAALKFTRDSQNRITKAIDPANRAVSYAYTTAGDLDTITSPLSQVSRNAYAAAPAALAHLLTSYTDAAGVQQLRNEYDATGKLVAQYDALGNKVDFSARDLSNHTQSVTDRRGNTTTYTFDDAGNITKIVDALQGVTEATFDVYGNQTMQIDPLHRQSSTTYDAPSGTVLKQTDALGHYTESAWNFYTINGNHTPQMLQWTTDGLRQKTTFLYTSPGMLNVIADPLNHKTQFGWGGPQFDQLAQMTDPTGRITYYQNDSLGRKIQETDPAGNITKYTYDAAGHLQATTKTRVVNGATQTLATTNTVDTDGNVLSTTDALGHVTQNTWTTQRQLATQTDPLGRITTYSYDVTGRPIKATYPDSSTESTGYDPNGNEVSQTDRAGRVTKTEYDPLNRPTVVTYPDTATTITHYDSAGQVDSTTDEILRTTNYKYDDAGRKTDATDPASHTTHYRYDDANKLTDVTDALTHTTHYDYDAANRKTKTTWPDLTFTQYGYDEAGRKTSETDPALRKTLYHYDADGRLDQVTDPLTKVTKYGYDELGDKTSQTDALNHLTQWSYDSLGRATSHTLPDNRYETMGYDIVGRLINKTDYSGDATGYQYDAADRITKQNFADGSATATSYTPSGQVATLTKIENGSSKVTKYTYDSRDRLTDVLYPDNAKLRYVYDAAGQKTHQTITTPDGQSQSVDYTYDPAGNLTTVTANGKTFTYHYDDANRKIERDDPNGVVTKYTYDPNGRLKGYVTTQDSGASAPILAKGDYTLNAAGQRTALAYQAPDGQTRNLGYTYDGAGRLTKETRTLPVHTTTWTLDAVGNRTAQTKDGATSSYAYDTTDRLTAITGSGATTYAWDTNGQLQSKTVGTSKTTFTFNAQHLLSGATLPDSSVIQYTYGPDGNIAKRTKASGSTTQTTNYLVDPNLAFAQVVAEYDSEGHPSAIYVYGDELLLRTKPTQPNPNSYYHHDGLGSVAALTDDSGTSFQTYGYDAWGNLVESSGTDDNPYRYAGQRFDLDAGLIYLRARWYEPATGRFVSPDSMGGSAFIVQSLNKYLYANGDPSNATDPGGLMTLGDTAATNSINGILNSISTAFSYSRSIGGGTLRYLGVAVEDAVKQVLLRVIGQTGFRSGIRLVGPGGQRVIDFLLTVGNRLTYLEVKYGLPRQAGPALVRLVGQMRTATAAAAAVDGNVVLFTWAAPSEAQMALLLSELGEGATAIQHVQGLIGLSQYLRIFFLGI